MLPCVRCGRKLSFHEMYKTIKETKEVFCYNCFKALTHPEGEIFEAGEETYPDIEER